MNVHFKTILFGDGDSGKTALTDRLTYQEDFNEAYVPTIGVDFASIHFESTKEAQHKNINVNFWHTAGQERYSSLSHLYYRECDLAVFCLNLAQPLNKEYIRKNIAAFQDVRPDTPILLVGTKSDEKPRKIITEELVALQDEFKFSKIYETSAKNNTNIDELRQYIINMAEKKARLYVINEAEDEAPTASPLDEAIKKAKPNSDLGYALTQLKRSTRNLTPQKQQVIGEAATRLLDALNDANNPEKELAIKKFEKECNNTINGSLGWQIVKNVAKAIALVVFTALAAVLVGSIGFAIGFSLGLPTGVGSVVTGAVLGSICGGISAILAANWARQRLFQPSKEMTTVDNVAKFANESIVAEV